MVTAPEIVVLFAIAIIGHAMAFIWYFARFAAPAAWPLAAHPQQSAIR
jgi:hypothetical protein